MASETSFAWNHFLPQGKHFLEKIGVDPHPAIDLLMVAFLSLVLAFFGGRKYRQKNMVKPTTQLNFSSLIGLAVEEIYNLVESNTGKVAPHIFWIMGGFFLYILQNNLLGLIPGFSPPTDKFSITFGLGILSFFLYNFLGVKAHKWSYIQHFMGPVLWLAPLLFCIELISHFVRPMTLGLRLFGNLVGDHTVLSVFSEKIFPILVPVPFMFLGIFVAMVQAFVFFQLSMVYVSGAIEEAH